MPLQEQAGGGCRSRDLTFVRLPAAAGWFWRQTVAVFGVMLLHPLSVLPWRASSYCHQEEGKRIKERGIQLRGFVFKPFSFLPLENVALCFPNLNNRQSSYSLGPFLSQIILEMQSPCLLWVSWHCGLPSLEKKYSFS